MNPSEIVRMLAAVTQRRRRVKLGLGGFASLTVAVLARVLTVHPSWNKVLVVAAIAQGVAYVCMMGRSWVHGQLTYYSSRTAGSNGAAPRGGWSLRVLAWSMVAINGVGILTAVWFVAHPSPTPQAVCAMLLVVATYVLADKVWQAAERILPPGQVTGRDWMQDHIWPQAERQESNLIGRAIVTSIADEQPRSKSSRFMAAILYVMVVVMAVATFGIVIRHPTRPQLSSAHARTRHAHHSSMRPHQPTVPGSSAKSPLPLSTSSSTPTYQEL
jgi:hypothetical protein